MKTKLFLTTVAFIYIFTSCTPRIEMDMSQWGDHAFIDNVEVVKLETDDHAKLEEFYNKQTPMEATGVRNIVISKGKALIDSALFVATVTVNAGEDLKYAGIKITHKGTKVEPLNGTPKAGIISDLTNRELKYRIKSADGSSHNWTIILK